MRNFILITTFLATFALAGCGGMRLYDKQADQLATSIRADYDAGKIMEVIAAERSNVEALEKKEIDAFVKTTLVERDLVLLGLTSDGDEPFIKLFNEATEKRLLTLSKPKSATATIADIRNNLLKLREMRRNLNDAIEDEARIREQLDRIDSRFNKLPACTEANRARLALPPVLDPKSPYAPSIDSLRSEAVISLSSALGSSTFAPSNEVLDVYRQYIDRCRSALDSTRATQPLMVSMGGLVQSTYEKLNDVTAQLKTDKAAAAIAKTDLKKAIDDEASRLKTASDATKEAATDLTCAGKKPEEQNDLCKALDKLSKLGDLGKKVVSEEKVDRINTLLSALSGQYDPGKNEEVEKSLAFVSAATRLNDALKEYQVTKNLPALEPLIIEKQIATAQLAQAKQVTDLQVARVGYRREMHEAVLEEAYILFKGRGQVANLTPTTPCGSVTASVGCGSVGMLLIGTGLKDDRASKREPPARSVYRGLGALSESYSVARVRYITAEMRLVLLPYRESLIQSEASLAAWNSLIDTPLKQIKTWHADGLKPDEIAQFLQAFGLLGIADRIKK